MLGELQHRWHLLVVDLVVNVEVALLPTALGAAVEDAPLDGAAVAFFGAKWEAFE